MNRTNLPPVTRALVAACLGTAIAFGTVACATRAGPRGLEVPGETGNAGTAAASPSSEAESGPTRETAAGGAATATGAPGAAPGSGGKAQGAVASPPTSAMLPAREQAPSDPPSSSRPLPGPTSAASPAPATGGLILRTVPSSPEPETAARPAAPAATPPTTGAPLSVSGSGSAEAAPTEGERRLTLRAEASPSVLAIGDVLTVEVLAESRAGVVDAPFHLLFDPSLFRFESASQGEYLSRDGGSVVFLVNGRTHPGDVAIGIGRTERARGIEGSGVLARVRLVAIAAGDAALRFDRAMAWDASGNPLEIAVVGSSVSVR